MNLQKTLAQTFVRLLASAPEGRAHLLNQIAEGEEQGEQRIFDDAIALVEDDDLKKLIQRHREDEIRHGLMFRECIARTGVEVGPVPVHLDMLRQLDKALGGFFERGLETKRDVMLAYVVLQVVEERACEQFEMYIDVFERLGDPETADVFRRVAKDEARHLKYCRAIALRYAANPEEYEKELVRIRELEARSFKSVQEANVDYILDRNLAPNAMARLFFRTIRFVGRKVTRVPYTSFATPAMAVA